MQFDIVCERETWREREKARERVQERESIAEVNFQ